MSESGSYRAPVLAGSENQEGAGAARSPPTLPGNRFAVNPVPAVTPVLWNPPTRVAGAAENPADKPTAASAGAVWNPLPNLAGRRCPVEIRRLHDKNLSNDRLMCADLCQTGFCLSPRFYVRYFKSIIKALINMHSFEFSFHPLGERKVLKNMLNYQLYDSIYGKIIVRKVVKRGVLIMINKIDFKAKNLTSNGRSFLLP